MADATSRPDVKTPQPRRDDLQRLIPDNIRLRRALEQLFIDVNQTLPDAIQSVGDSSQATTEDVSMGVFGATDRNAAHMLTWLSDVLGRADQDRAIIRRLEHRISWLESAIENRRAASKHSQPFIAPTLVNSWVNFGSGYNPAGFYKDPFGIVHLRGTISTGTIGTVAFTLPTGYQPPFTERCTVTSASAFGLLEITTNGDVKVLVGTSTAVTMDGATFRAA